MFENPPPIQPSTETTPTPEFNWKTPLPFQVYYDYALMIPSFNQALAERGINEESGWEERLSVTRQLIEELYPQPFMLLDDLEARVESGDLEPAVNIDKLKSQLEAIKAGE